MDGDAQKRWSALQETGPSLFFLEITMRSAVGRWEAPLRVALDFAVSAACDPHALH